jgi:uncharacterized membrane protein
VDDARVVTLTGVLAVGIALTASACWGVADFMAGLLSRRMSALLILLGQQLVGAVIVAIVVAGTLEDPPPTETILVSLAAGVAGAVALGCFYRALAIGTMSVVAPISTSGAVLPVAVGLLTGDRPSAVQAIGLAVTMVGVLLASRELAEGEAAGPGEPAQHPPRARGRGRLRHVLHAVRQRRRRLDRLAAVPQPRDQRAAPAHRGGRPRCAAPAQRFSAPGRRDAATIAIVGCSTWARPDSSPWPRPKLALGRRRRRIAVPGHDRAAGRASCSRSASPADRRSASSSPSWA